MNLKCYSDWQLGAIQIDLTPLTLRITEDSAKQLMINQFIYDNIQKMLKTLSKVNIRYLFNLINSHKIFF